MTLADLIRGRRAADSSKSATATPATLEGVKGRTVATVASVAVAKPTCPEGEPLPDPAAESRRQGVLAKLTEQPGMRYALMVGDQNADPVLLTIGIRDVATFDLAIPAAKFDPFLLLDLIERHGATVH